MQLPAASLRGSPLRQAGQPRRGISCSLQSPAGGTSALQLKRPHACAAPIPAASMHSQPCAPLIHSSTRSNFTAMTCQRLCSTGHPSSSGSSRTSSSRSRRRALVPCASAEAAEVAAMALGYGCMVGSCFRSLPQVLKVLSSGTAVGLSLTSNILELLTDVVKLAYNMSKGYHIAAFGENLTCAIQGVVLVALIWWHSQLTKEHALVAALALGAFCVWIFSPAMCPPAVMSALQASTIAVGVLGRVPQVILNIRRGNAGVLSASSCAMNLAGNLARVYTTVVLTGDSLVLGGAMMMAVLNATLLQQALATRAGRQQRVAVLA